MERRGINPEEATFWYNVTPWKETEESSVPPNLLSRYCWKELSTANLRNRGKDIKNSFSVGDEVWLKHPPLLYTKQWMPGKVTSIVSKHAVCVVGMLRHVRFIRKQRSGVTRGSRGCLQADNLRGLSSAIESGRDVGENGSPEHSSDQEAPEMLPSENEVPEDEVLEDLSQSVRRN